MTKKQHPHTPHPRMSRHAISRLEKERRIRRIITIASAVFLAAIVIAIGVGLYIDKVRPMNETVLEVNGREFDMGYYVDFLDIYGRGADPAQLQQIAQQLPTQIVRDEIIRQAGQAEGIVVTNDEVKAELEENDLPNDRVYRDSAAAALYAQRVEEMFRDALPETMVQVQFEIMLTESRAVADKVVPLINSGTSITNLVDEYSANPNITPLQDWVPPELLANPDVKNAVQSLDPGTVMALPDQDVVKPLGYWLIEVIDRDDSGAVLPRAILAGSEAEALEARARLMDGEEWATIVEEYSQFSATDENGELDFITAEDVVSETFNETAFALELNTLSEPVRDTEVQTTGGYWVVKLLDREDRELASNMADAMAGKEFTDWYARHREAATVEQSLTPQQIQSAIEQFSQ
mgnify:CR=1 FL=1